MQTQQENDELTQIGPGKPMGELFRRFWLPALLTEELPGPDCTPVRVRLLGEDLIAFKDSDGKPGLVDAFCPHRSAPMFFGRNEEGGLRCVYHGWKFDVDGNCTEMPNCVEGDNFRNKVRITSYPVFEAAGMVWAYLGPKDKMPPRPGYPWMTLPVGHTYVMKYELECNYLQSLENEFDPSHAQFLHTTLDGQNMTMTMWSKKWSENPVDRNTGQSYSQSPFNRKQANFVLEANGEIVDTPFGSALVRKSSSPEGDRDAYFMATPFWMPCFSSAGGLSAPGVFPLNIKVPIDDTHTAFFRFKWSREPLSQKVLAEMTQGNYEFPERVAGTYLPAQNKTNDYGLDRVKQRFFNYSGMMNTPVQDFAVTENQRGPITDRTKEVLCSADKYLIHVRRRLLNAARALVKGEEPSEPWAQDSYGMQLPRRAELPAGRSVPEAVEKLLDPAVSEVTQLTRVGAR